MNIRHTGIYVRNIERMINFYCELFELEIVSHEIEEGSFTDAIFQADNMHIDVCKLRFHEGQLLELIHCMSMEDSRKDEHVQKIYEYGKMHVAVTVPSADALYERLILMQGIPLSRPCVNPNGTAKVFFARDPEDNYLEIVEEI